MKKEVKFINEIIDLFFLKGYEQSNKRMTSNCQT